LGNNFCLLCLHATLITGTEINTFVINVVHKVCMVNKCFSLWQCVISNSWFDYEGTAEAQLSDSSLLFLGDYFIFNPFFHSLFQFSLVFEHDNSLRQCFSKIDSFSVYLFSSVSSIQFIMSLFTSFFFVKYIMSCNTITDITVSCFLLFLTFYLKFFYSFLVFFFPSPPVVTLLPSFMLSSYSCISKCYLLGTPVWLWSNLQCGASDLLLVLANLALLLKFLNLLFGSKINNFVCVSSVCVLYPVSRVDISIYYKIHKNKFRTVQCGVICLFISMH
jgi:hypothetical protein